MTRKQLEDLGLGEEQIKSIMAINGGDIENAKATNSTEISSLKAQVAERDKQLETLKSSVGDAEAMKQQIADLQATNDSAKANHESEMNQVKLDYAVENALSSAKAKNSKAVKALLDLSEAKIDKEGNVKGLQEQLNALVSDEGTNFLFEKQQQPSFKGFQPGVAGDQKPNAGVDTSNMNYDELCAYLATDGATLE